MTAPLTFAEKLAAKKAERLAQEAAAKVAPASQPAFPQQPIPQPVAPAPAPATTVSLIPENMMVATPENKPEPVHRTDPTAGMNFAQKLAWKKEQAALLASGQVAPAPAVPAVIKQEIKPLPPASVVPAAMVPAVIAPAQAHSSAEEAYADIKPRIDQLCELAGEPLENAMTELKRSLLQNPAAVSLMLDEDIGKMVIALRQLTGQAAEDAAKPAAKKGGGGKAKNVQLSAEQLEQAFLALDAEGF